MALFLIAFIIINPTTYALNSGSADEFEDLYINPVLEMDATYTNPLTKDTFTKHFRIDFNTLKPVKDGESHDCLNTVDTDIAIRPVDYLLNDYEGITEIKQVKNYYNGHTEYEIRDPEGLLYKENSEHYSGWFPSPHQIADYIAYSNGWVLNSVDSAERIYEIDKDNYIVDAIYEEEIPSVIINSSYELGQITCQQDTHLLKSIGATELKQPIRREGKLSFTVNDLSADGPPMKDGGVLVGILAIGLIVWYVGDLFGWWGSSGTTYGKQDLIDAYEIGYTDGINDTIAVYTQRINTLLYNGDIDNATYALLLSLKSDLYNDAMNMYSNPYEALPEDKKSFFHTVISVIKVIIIVGIIMALLIGFFWIFRKLGGFKLLKAVRKSDEGSIVPPNAIRIIEFMGLMTGYF